MNSVPGVMRTCRSPGERAPGGSSITSVEGIVRASFNKAVTLYLGEHPRAERPVKHLPADSSVVVLSPVLTTS